MVNSIVENEINKFVSDRLIKYRKNLSTSFNMVCEKIVLNTGDEIIAKYYQSINHGFNSIKSETNSIVYLSRKFPTLFPNILFNSDNLLIINYIKNNNIKNNNYQKILVDEILKLHVISNDKYGFNFDAQIGGLQLKNNYELNWVSFFREKRLNMIFEKINQSNPMPKQINIKLEKLLKNIGDFIPTNPKISLLHGDLWSGNILFNDGKLVGLIDPGIYYGHNELEIAYLTWFKYIDNKFLDYYSSKFKIDKNFALYEPVYQLYFSLLNIHLWSREYIKDTDNLLKKIFKHRD